MLSPGLSSALLESWNYFLYLAVILVPLFIGASFLVALAQEYLPPEKVERKLRGYDEGSGNVAAAGLGAVTPFCGCSTVPVLAGLLQAGAPLGLAFSFLLASPLVNWIAILLLFGLFGIEITVWYVILTLLAAIVGGLIIGRLGLTDYVKDVRIEDQQGQAVATDGGANSCCAGATSTTTHRNRVETAAREAWSFFTDTVPYLVLGMTIGALIHGVIPVELLHTVLGQENPLAVPLAALAGAPVYISLSGMLPIAAALSDQGIAIGTVLAFVIGGAGVSIPNLVLLNTLFKRRLLFVYAGTVVTIGILVGVVFNTLIV
ncbi:permease [Natrialba chahannaoensis JCM 10990]|uniref:Permease n=1 Tax=Natrialba chahannaoensis JCM 10990 TaxID=1227492 RepID=M0AL80_9EURY|nr:permease [Natrialba chahannaoensis]ELY99076.1 permease [Natrialba chahannaoensis JCM 10990]